MTISTCIAITSTIIDNDDNLLFNTLKIIWRNYLQSLNGDIEVKQHWLQLFLYNFQFTNRAVTSEDDLWKSFLKPIPEQIYSYFLEEVYKIITNSKVIAPSTTKTTTKSEIAQMNFLEEFEIGNSSNYLELLKKNHNFVQLILRQPSDCNKIVTLRQFLTQQMGQHLLQFFLCIDIQLLTSRESFCNLCINLFPNCSWSGTNDGISEQLTKSLSNCWDSLESHKMINNKSNSGTHTCAYENHLSTSLLIKSNKYVEFEAFNSANRSSDEIALLIIHLLKKFTTTHEENGESNEELHSTILTIYEFIIQCLQRNNSTFSSERSALCIKCELIKLLTQCLNNLTRHIKKLDEYEDQLLENILQQVLNLLENEYIRNSYEFSCNLLHIILKFLYNIVAIYNSFDCTYRNKCKFLYSQQILNDNVNEKCLNIMQHILFKYSLEKNNGIKGIIIPTYQLYIEIIEVLVRNHRLKSSKTRKIISATTSAAAIRKVDSSQFYNQEKHISLKVKKSKANKGNYRKTYHEQQHTQYQEKQCQCRRQIHCHFKLNTAAHWACQLQKIFIKLLHLLPHELLQITIIHVEKYGTCCCHYTIATCQQYFNVCVVQRNRQILLQKYLYKFFYYRILRTLYEHNSTTRNNSASNNSNDDDTHSNISNTELTRNVDAQCLQCYKKSHCVEFQKGLLQLYFQFFNTIQKQQNENFNQALNLLLFLKHLKCSLYFIKHYYLANGIIAEIILPTFRKFKTLLLNTNVNNELYPESDMNVIHLIVECLNIFVIYLNNNALLVRNFFNEDNIKHLEDLWFIATTKTIATTKIIKIIFITYNLCEIIKIGIERSTFLGDTQQEQQRLQQRLIILQFNHTEQVTTSFNQHIKYLIFNNNDNKSNKKERDKTMAILLNDNIYLVLNTLILQWSLNYNLIKINMNFYMEFMKIHQIGFTDNTNENDIVQDRLNKNHDKDISKFTEGSPKIINILQLNYNALVAYLLLIIKTKHKTQHREPCNNGNRNNKGNNNNNNGINECANNAKYSTRNLVIAARQILIPTHVHASQLQSMYTLEQENYFALFSSTITLEHNVVLMHDDILEKIKYKPKPVLVIPSIYLNDIAHSINWWNDDDQLSLSAFSFLHKFLLSSFQLSSYYKENYGQCDNNDDYNSTIVLYNIKFQLKHSAATKPATIILGNLNCLTYSYLNDSYNLISSMSTSTNTDNSNEGSTIIDETLNTNETNLFNKVFRIFDNLMPRFNYLSSSITPAPTSPTIKSNDFKFSKEVNDDTYRDCRRLLLKLFEVTMAICLKEYYQSNDKKSNKMQKHLLKLRHVILCNATNNWEDYASDQNSHENLIIQALQSLLKVASEIPYEKIKAKSSHTTSQINDAGKIFNSRLLANNTMETTMPQKHHCVTMSDANSFDVDYFSALTSSCGICSDAELDLSETESDDIYGTADEGYDADIEIFGHSETEHVSTELLNNDIWNSYQPASHYRLPLVHEGICRIVIEILIELSIHCCRQPIGWSDNLAQLINRLYVIRDCLGDSLFLLKGFAPILSCNDARLQELQQRILELIVNINTPDVLTVLFGIFAEPDPPIDILIKFFHYTCTNTLKKIQPHLELQFIPKNDMKSSVNVESQMAFHIDFLREYHRHCNSITPLTRAPCLIPIPLKTQLLWQPNGFTISMWMQAKSDSVINVVKKTQNGNNDIANANDRIILKKTHILSVGTDQAMLSIYLSDAMHLIFETCKPNRECLTMPKNEINTEDHSTTTGKETIKETEATPTTNSTIFKALQHTKNILLNSLNNINVFHSPVLLYPIDSLNFEHSQQCLQDWQCQMNQWYHLIFSIKMNQDSINIIICINGLDFYTITLPFHNIQYITKNHIFQLIALGDCCSSNQSTKNLETPLQSIDGSKSSENYILCTAITNLMLFKHNNFPKDTFLHLTAMGPDFTQLSECEVANWKPNYGYLNLRRLSNINFNNFHEAMKILRESRVLCYTAQHPYTVTTYEAAATIDPKFVYGNDNGLILYGEPKQFVIPSLQSAVILSGGLSNLLYLFARVVEKSSKSNSQAMALDILLKVAFSESQLYTEFHYSDYLNLIGYVIKTDRCSKDGQLLQSLLNNACSPPSSVLNRKNERLYLNENTTALVIYPKLITKQLQRYSDWHRSGCEHAEPLELLLNVILALTREKHPYRDFNITQLTMANLMKDLLNLFKIYVIESPNPVYISKKAADYFLNIISIFAGSPPTSSLMDEIMKLLLLLHKPSECFITHDRSKFYYLLTNEVPLKDKLGLTGVSASFRKSIPRHFNEEIAHPGIAESINDSAIISNLNSIQNNDHNDQIDDHLERQRRIQHLHYLHKKKSSYKQPLHDFIENLEINADCSNLNKGAVLLLNPGEFSDFKWRKIYKRLWSHGLIKNHQPYHFVLLQRSLPMNITKIRGNKLQRKINIKKKISRNKRIRRVSTTNNVQVTKNQKQQEKYSNSPPLLTSPSNSTNINSCDQTFINSNRTSTKTTSTLRNGRHHNYHYHHFMGGILTKPDTYNSMGLITLQSGLLLLLKDFLCLLPDTAVHDVLHHYIKIEYLLVLANHHNTGVRTAILKLIDALIQRLYPQDVKVYLKNFYNYHLANQITIYNVDIVNFETCLMWVTGHLCNMHDLLLLDNIGLRIEQRFGLNTLMAIASKSPSNGINDKDDFSVECFTILKKLFVNASYDEKLLLIEAGLIQSTMKALYTLYVKSNNNIYNQKGEELIADLLDTIGQYSISSVGHINILWDIINILDFYQQKKYSQTLITKFRSMQARLQMNWLQMFFIETNIPWNFRVTNHGNATLSHTEINKRLELLVNRSTQFFTIYNEKSSSSNNEVELFKWLVSYHLATNQRCHHLIVWGLQLSQPKDLRTFIIDALWIASQDDFMPQILCDDKSIKRLLWLNLLENIKTPIKHIKLLCEYLNIHENDTIWNLDSDVHEFQSNPKTTKQKLHLDKTIYKYENLTQSCIESSMITTRKVTELQNAERKLLMNYMKDYNDTHLYSKWLNIIRQLTHEGASWYNEYYNETSWELDDTEGPSRVHMRLRRCYLDLDKRFFMIDYRDNKATESTAITGKAKDAETSHQHYIHSTQPLLYCRPLYYLTANYDHQLNISLNSQILYNFPAIYLPVDGEIDGEIIITDYMLHFIATHHCKYFYIHCDISDITEIWLKRYQHKDSAFELYLDSNQSLFFMLQNPSDMKIMHEIFCDKIVTQTEQQNKLLQITQHWCEGLLTNWEYLMCLNQIAGRTYNDLMQYPILPWILSNYTEQILDLTDKRNFRNLQKPIAIQSESSQQHYINNYAHIKNNETHIGSLPLQPYHYSSHYSNSGTVLHFLVRVPPFTSHFLRYQDNNFDIPDRTFHSISTTWNLASRDSSTDVKELIPEFFCLPEMFENFENFNFGYRQNGERVNDVQLPPWCSRDPRLFVLIHRQALETELVRNDLHNWIDLIFGYKQTGDAAIDAINVFHPVTYPSILDCHLSDPVERNAVQTMIRTYGQMPRQLFHNPHPASKQLQYELDDKQSIVPNVHGLRWGIYVGSPQLPKPILGDIYKLPNTDYLLSFTNTNVIYGLPKNYNIMQGPEIDTFNVISWGYSDNIIRIQSLNKFQHNSSTRGRNLFYNNNLIDEISACGCEPYSNQLWFGHKSGRLSVYKCSTPDMSQRFNRSRQSYVRGLRLSYNSALRKITTKSSSSLSTFFDLDRNDYYSLNSRNFNDDLFTATSSSTATTSIKETYSGNSSCSGNSNGINVGLASNSSTRNGRDLRWHGPTILIRHTDEITCIKLSIEFKIVVSAGKDGLAVIWDLNNWSYIRTIERPSEIHHSPITLATINPTTGDIVTVHNISKTKTATIDQNNIDSMENSPDECFEVTEENLDDFINVSVNPNGKSILRLHTINARYVKHIIHEEHIMAACYSFIKEGVGVNVIATAMENGIIYLWSSWNLSYVNKIVTGISNIKSLTYSTYQHLVVLTEGCYIQVWQTDGLYGALPKFPQIIHH